MRKLCCALLAAALALSGGCALTVRSDANPALIGNVKCGSYAWAGAFRGNSPLRSTVANPLNEERLRAAIATHLAPGGTVQPVGSTADCLVGYGIGNTYVVDGTGAWPYYGGWYGYGWGGWDRAGDRAGAITAGAAPTSTPRASSRSTCTTPRAASRCGTLPPIRACSMRAARMHRSASTMP